MQRGSFDTHRWPRSLAVSAAVSLALHALLLVGQLGLPPTLLPHIDIVVNHGVEIGIDEPLPGAEAPPPTPNPSIEEPPAPPTQPPPAPAPRVARSHPTPPPTPPPAVPEESNATLEAADAALAQSDAEADATAVAEADVHDGGDESALAMNDDAGADASDDAAALALADVSEDAGAQSVPGLASAAGALAAAVPRGSVVTLLLRMDHIRGNPNGPRVGELLRGIRDWRQVLDGTEIDPVEDFNTVLLASADPFGTPDDPPDLSVIVRTRAPRGFLRASIEQMAGARSPSSIPIPLPDGGVDTSGTLRARFEHLDAGVLPRPTRPVWRRQGAAEIATIDRYMGPHAVMLLGEDLAAIASPARVPQLLAVLGARTAAARDRAQNDKLLALLQADGLRNLLSLPGRASMIPTRADVVIYETSEHDRPDGGVTLLAVMPYDDEAMPARAAPFVTGYVNAVIENVDRFSSSLEGRIASASGAVHFDRIHSALQAVQVRADGATLRVEATLTADEVAELLNAQRLAQMFR